MTLDKRQKAAVLTGLRLLQDALKNDADFPICDLYLMVFTDDGAHEPLSIEEIDDLAESLNTSSNVSAQ